ncbi:MAG: ERCC4 domain-containing protein [Promethearchaeota archaeon]
MHAQLHPPKRLFLAAAIQSEAMKLLYAIEIFETQGVTAVKQFLTRIHDESKKKSGSKSSKNLAADPYFIEARAYISSMETEHPKLDEVIRIISDYFHNNPSSRVIIFTHYRDTSQMVYERLKTLSHVKPVRFIGQGSKINDKGLTQKQQREIINKFRRGDFNVLIATSVAEEGLDIPATELVIFYEPIPSEIRNIQRRGRTARNKPGNVIILITKGTTDEGYYWSSKRREKLMRSELELMRASLKRRLEIDSENNIRNLYQKNNQKTLKEFNIDTENHISIIVDHREYRSLVVRSLISKQIDIQPQQLPVGDYIVSNRVGIERKDVDDFLNSLINGTLFKQIKSLRDTFPRPLLIIEGNGLFTKRNMSHQAIYGCIVSIIVDYGVSIVTTKDGYETAEMLAVMALREQRQEKKPITLRGEKQGLSFSEQQQFIIEGLPQISSIIARRLLDHFGSIRALINASEEDLQEVKGIGKQIASSIYQILNEPYQNKSE